MIGKEIRKIRKFKKITLTELSKKSGVQLATLCRIEKGQMVGTVDSHFAISNALGIDIKDIYNPLIESQTRIEIIKPKAKKRLDKDINKQALSNLKGSKMLPILIQIKKNKATRNKNLLNSERFIYILEGSVKIIQENQSINLKENDSFYFNTSGSSLLRNTANSVTKILSITYCKRTSIEN